MSEEMAAAKAQIDSILSDCRTFVQQTRDEANSDSASMLLETQALHEEQQAIVRFVDGVPDTVASLKSNLDVATAWLASSQLQDLAGRIVQVEVSHEELEPGVDRRFEEFRAAAFAARGMGSSGFDGQAFQGSTPQTKDRNIFDPRDYKLAELGPKPTAAKWKKRRPDFEGFADTIGISWHGTSGPLRELRHRDQP